MNLIKKALTITAIVGMQLSANAQDSKECEGYKMVAEGAKICTYYDDYDSKTRDVYATIKNDSIIYTIFRTTKDGGLDMLKKWHLYIGMINFGDAGTGVFSWMNGSQEIPKINFQIIEGQTYYFDEKFCGRERQASQVNTQNTLEMSFADAKEANLFFEKVKAIKVTLPAPGSEKKGDDNTATSGSISIFNDLGKEIYLKQGSTSTHILKNETKKFSSLKIGDELYWSDASGKKGALALKVTAQMLKDSTIKLSTGTKK